MVPESTHEVEKAAQSRSPGKGRLSPPHQTPFHVRALRCGGGRGWSEGLDQLLYWFHQHSTVTDPRERNLAKGHIADNLSTSILTYLPTWRPATDTAYTVTESFASGRCFAHIYGNNCRNSLRATIQIERQFRENKLQTRSKCEFSEAPHRGPSADMMQVIYVVLVDASSLFSSGILKSHYLYQIEKDLTWDRVDILLNIPELTKHLSIILKIFRENFVERLNN